MFSEQVQQNSNIQARTRRAQIQIPIAKQGQQKINPRALILELGQKIKSTYAKLEKTYEQSSVKNENYLLEIYVKVLNQMLDEVVFAQEQVFTVDYKNLKQNKKIQYLTGVKNYRDECMSLKEQIDRKKNILKEQRKNTNNLESAIQELEILCDKKQDELGLLKSYISTKQKQASEKGKQQKNRVVETIIQIEQSGEKQMEQCIKESKAGHSTKNESKMTFYKNHTKDIKDEKTIKSKSSISTRLREDIRSHRQLISDNKYQSSNIEGRKINSQGKPKQQQISMSISMKSKSQGKSRNIKQQKSKEEGSKYKINSNELELHTERFEKLSSSLWLYKPTSFRKRKQKMSKQGTIYSNNTLQLLKNRIKGYSQNLIDCKKTTNILDQEMTQRLDTQAFNSNNI